MNGDWSGSCIFWVIQKFNFIANFIVFHNSEKKMKIDKLILRNFKKFSSFEVELDPQFNLLIGENGSGKTSILDALSVALGVWLVNPPDTTLANSGKSIEKDDIRLSEIIESGTVRFQEEKPVSVTATGSVHDRAIIEWQRNIAPFGTRTSNVESGEALQIIEDLYKRDLSGEDILFPVIAYYGAGRAWIPSRKRYGRDSEEDPDSRGFGPDFDQSFAKTKNAEQQDLARRWSAFYDCLTDRVRIPDIVKWFKRETIARLDRPDNSFRPAYLAVKYAVMKAVPGATSIRYDADRNTIVYGIGEINQPLDNLSAGQRMMVALVADIAIKAASQNPYLLSNTTENTTDLPEVLQKTPGVVLIDELDVHLHPSWQRRVVSDLTSIFPSIQFVATTHSPQIIGEVPLRQIRIIQETGAKIPSAGKGVDSNWILDHVMYGDSRSPEAQRLIELVEEALEEESIEKAKGYLNQYREFLEEGNDGEYERLTGSIESLERLSNADDS